MSKRHRRVRPERVWKIQRPLGGLRIRTAEDNYLIYREGRQDLSFLPMKQVPDVDRLFRENGYPPKLYVTGKLDKAGVLQIERVLTRYERPEW